MTLFEENLSNNNFLTSKRIITNKNFWKTIKSFLTRNACLVKSDTMLSGDEKMITNKKKIVQLFNDHYINIVGRSCGTKPNKVESDMGSSNKKYS